MTPAPGPTRAPEPSWRPPPRTRRVLVWAGGASLLAGLLHAMVAPMHFEEWWGYGTFFVASAVAQVALGLGLLLFAIHRARRYERLFLVAGVLGNALLIVLYAYSRLVGMPLGPAAGEREPVEVVDLATKAAEVVVVGLLGVALARPSPAQGFSPARPSPRDGVPP